MTKKLMRLSFASAVVLGCSGGALGPAPKGPGPTPGIAFAAEGPAREPTVQEPPAQQPPGKESPAPESAYLRKDARPTKPLSLMEALETALSNNLDVAIRKMDPEAAAFGVTQAQAVFDPLLGASASHSRSRDEPQSGFQAGSSKLTTADVSLAQTLEEGTRYSATWSSSRFERPSLINPISPSYNSNLALSFTQPLLRGFGFAVNRTQIEVARLGVATSEEEFRRTVIDTLGFAANGYWDLTAAISALDVARESLKLAQDLLDLNRKKVEVGTLAPIQITEAQASVVSRELGVIVSEAAIQNAEDNLRRIMNVPPDSPDWGVAIIPSDKAGFEPAAFDLDEMIRSAIENRPEIQQAKDSVRTAELNYRFDQNARKPGLDAFGSFTPSGNNYEFDSFRSFVDANGDGLPDDLNGDGKISGKDKVSGAVLKPLGGWYDSAREVFDDTIRNWSVGLNFSIPLGNRNAQAAEARSKIAYEQSQMSLENVDRSIRVEVRRAVRAVETGLKSVAVARASVGLQEKKLEAEQKRYDNGMSTSFQVLSFQGDLTSARVAEIASITLYNQAIVDLGRVTATLPRRYGVKLVGH